jgi:UDP-N-acetylmuramoyl-tripeptide--D-alanyl-D-alanine ligase
MQRLVGVKDSVIIDDTYNASPEAVLIALDALYTFPRRNKVAILGMMNELGKISEIEHRKIGKYCDPKILDLVVTIGKDANHFLAPEARQNGCRVYEAKDAKDAGQYVFDHLKEDSVILAKGSQNGVFAEEALKPLLANKADVAKLVRQSDYWMSKK